MKTFQILAVVTALALPSCISLSRYHSALKQQQAEADAKYNGTIAQVAVVIGNLRERLVRFNQIDEAGNLRPLKVPKAAAAPRAAALPVTPPVTTGTTPPAPVAQPPVPPK